MIKKNILITGGAGFIGSNLVKFILKKNIARKIIVLDNYSSGSKLNHISNKKITYIKGCLLYTSPSPRDTILSRMPSSA